MADPDKYCETCKYRKDCRKICGRLQLFLNRKPDDRLYSDRHIRRMEQPYDTSILESIAGERATRFKHGMSKGSDLSGDDVVVHEKRKPND